MTVDVQALIAAGDVRKAELIEMAGDCLHLKRSPRSSTFQSSSSRSDTKPERLSP
jgi:hypothetical protein